jgi:hypothetical protein
MATARTPAMASWRSRWQRRSTHSWRDADVGSPEEVSHAYEGGQGSERLYPWRSSFGSPVVPWM